MSRLPSRLILLQILGLVVASLGHAVATSARAQSDGSLSVPISDPSGSGLTVDEVRLYRASYALVIGIDDYSNGWPRLAMAVKDARIVAEELRRQGFEVTIKTNLKATELDSALREFFIVKGSDPEARLFLWYAGHGYTEGGEGFLVPADAPRADLATQFMLSALPMRRFGEYARLAKAKHVFGVFDSCFAGTIFDSERGPPPRAITRATALPVRQFLTSGDANQTVFDNGTFRELFLRALRGEEGVDANGDGFVTGTEIGLFLTDRITNLTRSRQTPRNGKLLDKEFDRGDFVFRAPGKAPAEKETPAAALAGKDPVAPSPSESLTVELAYWDAIKTSSKAADYKAYLEAYPEGRFATLARVRAEPPPPPAAAEPGDPPAAAAGAAAEPAAPDKPRPPRAAEARPKPPAERPEAGPRKPPPKPAPLAAVPPTRGVVAAPPVAPASEDPPALPIGTFRPPAVGTRFHLDNGRFVEVTGIDGLVFHLINSQEQRSEMLACCWEGDLLPQQGQPSLRGLWPLRVGNRAQFTLAGYGSDQAWTHSLRVVRQERIRVPAGEFEAFVIEWERKGLAQNNQHALQTYWYVPELGFPVRSDLTLQYASTRAKPWQLVRIERPSE